MPLQTHEPSHGGGEDSRPAPAPSQLSGAERPGPPEIPGEAEAGPRDAPPEGELGRAPAARRGRLGGLLPSSCPLLFLVTTALAVPRIPSMPAVSLGGLAPHVHFEGRVHPRGAVWELARTGISDSSRPRLPTALPVSFVPSRTLNVSAAHASSFGRMVPTRHG